MLKSYLSVSLTGGKASARDAVGARVDVEAAVAQETDQRRADFFGQLDGQRRRRRDGGENRHTGRGGLLHNLEAEPPADHHYMSRERDHRIRQRVSDHFVDRIVASDVLAYREHRTVKTEDRGAVKSAGRGKHALPGAEFLGQGEQRGWRDA